MCTLYNRIINLCEEKGISGSRMCLELGMSKSTLSDLKSGRKKGLNAETAHKIASYLGVSVAYLLGENSSADSVALTDEEAQIIAAYRDMTPQKKKALADLLGVSVD